MVALSILRRKLLRDIGRSKWQFITVIVTVTLGVAFFTALYSSYENLNRSVEYTYEKLNIADFLITLNETPLKVVDEVRSISGVKAAVGRMVLESRIIPHATEEGVVGRFVSIPSGEAVRVNDVYIVKGADLDGEEDGVLVEKGFAEKHKLAVGDYLAVGVTDISLRLKVTGIAVSPEQIIPARDNIRHCSVILRDWGVFFVSESVIDRIFNVQDTVNEIAVSVTEPSQRKSIIAAVRNILEPYGVKEVIAKENYPSYKSVKIIVDSLENIGLIFPIFFLTVAATNSYILISRMVARQRPQIGVLLATGYTRRQIIFHYLGFALSIGVIGSVIGPIVGYTVLIPLTRLLATTVNLPFLQIEPSWTVILIAVALSILLTGIAGLLPAWSALQRPPVELMWLQRPASGRIVMIERLLPFLSKLSTSWKITYRNIFRNRRRSTFTVIGISLSLSTAFVPFAFMDAMDSSLNLMFNNIQRYDLRATFTQPQNITRVSEVRSWEGVKTVDPLVLMAVPLKHGDDTHTTLVSGLQEDATLYGIYDFDGKKITVSRQGVLLSKAFREFGNVRVGETVTLDLSEIISKYWKNVEEQREELSEQMIRNITQLHKFTYTLRRNLTDTHMLLYSFRGNVTQALNLLFGVPSGYTSTWTQVLETTYLRDYPNTSLTIYDVNRLANQSYSSRLAVELEKIDEQYATVIMDYYQLFYHLWNSTFLTDRPEPTDLLEKLTPTQRMQQATDSFLPFHLDELSVSPDEQRFYKTIYGGFNFITWTDDAYIDQFVLESFFRSVDIVADNRDVVRRLYFLGPNFTDEQFDIFIIDETAKILPRQFFTLAEKIYSLGPKATIDDFRRLSESTADQLVNEAIIKLSLPEKYVDVKVEGFVNDPFGYSAFLPLDKTQRIFGLGDEVTALMISLSDNRNEDVEISLYERYPVWNVESGIAIRQDVTNMLGLFYGFLGAIASFGIIMAFTIVFNTVTASVLERNRVATMRTLGIGSRKIAGIITIENLILSIVGLILGIPIADLARYFIGLWDSELISMDFVVYPYTYLFIISGILAIALFSEIPSIRHIYRLNLAKITKEQVS